MSNLDRRAAGAALILLCTSLFAQSAFADSKTLSPVYCRPVGPGTLASELTYNSYGIFNPGVTNESVICDLPVDADTAWSLTPGVAGSVSIHFRAGAVAGKVACTLYTGSTVSSAGATSAVTNNPAAIVSGARSSYSFDLVEVSGQYATGPAANVVCTLTPKAALGMLRLNETNTTNTF